MNDQGSDPADHEAARADHEADLAARERYRAEGTWTVRVSSRVLRIFAAIAVVVIILWLTHII